MLIAYIGLNLIVWSQFNCIHWIIECLIALLNFNCYCSICINVSLYVGFFSLYFIVKVIYMLAYM